MTDGALSVRVGQLARALQRLEEALARPDDPIVRDACIQRFGFSFEMAWKAIRHYPTGEGLACASPRCCVDSSLASQKGSSAGRRTRPAEESAICNRPVA